MPDIKHMGYGTLTIQVGENDKLEFGPRETKDIAADDLGSDGVQKALADGLVIVLPSTTTEKKPKPAKGSSPSPQ
jgi:hypothetical protein